MEKITIIGFGSWGIAMACVLAKNGHDVTMYEPNEELAEILDKKRVNERSLPGIVIPDTICITSNIETATQSDILIVALSSKQIPDVFGIVAPKLR